MVFWFQTPRTENLVGPGGVICSTLAEHTFNICSTLNTVGVSGAITHRNKIYEKLIPSIGVWGVNSSQKSSCGPRMHFNKCLLYHPFLTMLTTTKGSEATLERQLGAVVEHLDSTAPPAENGAWCQHSPYDLTLHASLSWIINWGLHPSWAYCED